jgi:hypothetical protein
MASYPPGILDYAAELNNDNETMEMKYYTLFTKILMYWFPLSERYHICPQWRIPGSKRTVDLTITFVIAHNESPLLLVEVKAPSHFHSTSRRCSAIKQITRRLDTIGPMNMHADRLYAISAIGKRWRACYAFKGKTSKGGQPTKGIAAINSLRSPNPACWNPDVTSDHSFRALQEIIATIKAY